MGNLDENVGVHLFSQSNIAEQCVPSVLSRQIKNPFLTLLDHIFAHSEHLLNNVCPKKLQKLHFLYSYS